ncbi:lytic murein transglycosylase B [Chitinimonas lacunae]|uniref:Lytic murein transglycosylase B n=1 Tax=Chitinimonas lacunae TaxID=1963018 RepID=A0ABV8MJ57_9NEIS
MRFPSVVCGGLAALLLCCPAVAEELVAAQPIEQSSRYVDRPDVQAFIEELSRDYGFERQQLLDLFDQVVPRPQILAILDRPSTSRPYYEFRPDFVNATRIRLGVQFWREHSELLAAVADRYQIDPEYLVAVLGAETMWGRNTGSFRVLDALSTIAFDYPRRAEYFRKELREFLLLAREDGINPLSLKGSYAGAMGMPQFMPSSFRAYAADWDGDRRHDIWSNPGDTLASVANYFRAHGWHRGAPLVLLAEVQGDAFLPLVDDKFNLHYRVSELAGFGVHAVEPPANDPLAVLAPLETAPGITHYWLGLQNFYTLTRYNRSTLYAMAVHEMAGAIRAAYLDPSLVPPEPAARRKAENSKRSKPARKGKRRR